jgi:hypothetical protein
MLHKQSRYGLPPCHEQGAACGELHAACYPMDDDCHHRPRTQPTACWDGGDGAAGDTRDTRDTGAHWKEDVGERGHVGTWTPRSQSGELKVG